MRGLKKFKPINGYSFKLMSLWIGVFAAIGVTTLLLTRAAVLPATTTVGTLPFTTASPFIWDNDSNGDVWTQEFVMALASLRQINLIGISQSPHPWRTGAENLQTPVDKARNSGFSNIPNADWDIGTYWKTALARPADGQIASTIPIDTPSSRMIRDRVLASGTPSVPVVIGAGGALTTVSSAYLQAAAAGRGPEFLSKVVVIANLGVPSTISISNYNTHQDEWAAYIAMSLMRVVVTDNSDASNPVIWNYIETLRASELTTYMKAKKVGYPYAIPGADIDAGPVLAFLYPTTGGFFTSATKVAVSGWGAWNPAWNESAGYKMNLNTYKADLRIAPNASGDDYYVLGVVAGVPYNRWTNAVGGAFATTPPPPPTDKTLPTVSITAPLAGTTVSAAAAMAATASDNVAVTKVEFYVDGALLGSDTTSPYNYIFDTTTYTNGDHNLTVKAYDAAGNIGTNAVVMRINNSTTPPPTPKKCDFNNDTKVDSNDLFILLANFNKTVMANTKGDCNGTGKVDTNDLFILLAGYGK